MCAASHHGPALVDEVVGNEADSQVLICCGDHIGKFVLSDEECASPCFRPFVEDSSLMTALLTLQPIEESLCIPGVCVPRVAG